MHKSFILITTICLSAFTAAQAGDISHLVRYQQESKHFVVIYWKSHSYLVPHILRAGENSLQTLGPIFNYKPSEKIIINTCDYHDFGAAGTTSVPHNYIRLDIAPIELDYENIPFNERIQWLLNHELVHIIVGDGTSKAEAFSRSLFSKVPPEREQPFFSVFYSLLTNFDRFSPDWHQESIAMFMETWLSGGYGRVLGNFDEMFFRSMVLENRHFPDPKELDAKSATTSFLLQMLYYLYGARFAGYISNTYGADACLDWFKDSSNNNFGWFDKKFKMIFGIELQQAWKQFIEAEKVFQRENLSILKQSPRTPIHYLSHEPLGWVTQPHLDFKGKKLFFGYHKAHELANFKVLDFKKWTLKTFATLPTPRMVQVAATAYDPEARLLFYTTNNNHFQRDIWLFDLLKNKKKLLFKDYRIGDLTICPKTRELWGVRHSAGKAILVRSLFPYTAVQKIVEFEAGVILQHLAISRSGRLLTATLHQPNGSQSIVMIDCNLLRSTGRIQYSVVTDIGSPEHPSWSSDEDMLYWNAYVNGVSNIYRCVLDSFKIEAVSHTLRGLFRPIQLTAEHLFAFEFTTEGFIPVIIPNQPAEYLPAIRYLGQSIAEQQPKVTKWALKPCEQIITELPESETEKVYNGFLNIEPHSVIPVISGFMHQAAVGVYAHLADPNLVHDIKVEMSYSPSPQNELMPRYHFDAKYEYKKQLLFRVQHNAANFYDLINKRKRSTMQTKIILGNTHYWKYDQPHRIKHVNQLAAYIGTQAINDNIVKVKRSDFFVFQSMFESSNLRRSVGSVDAERGTRWGLTLMTFHVEPQNFKHVGGIHGEWENYSIWGWPHNTLHLKLYAGIRYIKENMAIGRFYFGGFGNRFLENEKVDHFSKVFRFPGMPIYSLPAKHFVKAMVEQKLPPLRFSNAYLGRHCLSHADLSCFSQALSVEPYLGGAWIDLGAQLNLHFRHWFNLESTLSFGIARAWNVHTSSWEWFISFKPLRS